MKSLKHRLIAFALALAAALMLTGAAAAESDIELITAETVTEPLELPSGDLFYRYMLRKGAGIASRGALAGNELTGNDAVVYGIVKPGIEAVAAGRSSSTAFSITLDDLGIANDDGFSNDSWTAADLGVPALLNDEGRLTGEAFSALLVQAIQVNTGAVMRALLFDCPYDLFWFDKTKGMGTSMSYGTSGSGDGMRIYLSASGFSLNFAVASAYAGTGDYTTNAVNIARANAAALSAQSLVDSCRGLTDYGKLDAYRAGICDRVTYDHDAADDDSTPYGDPWQLVYVFDGDSSTNVVCEGYSKAFQYLCDLSHFAGSVQCYSVSGTMSGGSGAGAHMWNLVNMNDGVSYLVDVTNCDAGSAGYPGKLFMKGVTLSGTPHPYYINVGTAANPHNITYVYDEDVLARWSSAILTPSTTDYNEAAPVLSSLEITTPPAKTAYVHGEAFDPAGMVLTATYSDGTSATITDYTVSCNGADRTALRAGDSAVSIGFGGMSVSQPVTVGTRALTVSGLEAVNRAYEKGNLSVALAGGALEGVVAGDDVSAAIPTVGTLRDDSAGDGKAVTLPEIALNGEDAPCYTLTQPGGLTVDIAPAGLADAAVALTPDAFTYSGSACEPAVTVTLNGAALVPDTDYEVTYSDNIDAGGAAKVTVTGIGNYSGSVEASFSIAPASLASATVALTPDTFTYSGSVCEPAVAVTLNGAALVPDTDFEVAYSDNIDAGGAAKVTVTGVGNYSGSVEASFSIAPASLADAAVALTPSSACFTGQPIEPAVEVVFAGRTLEEGVDYTVEYADNIRVGPASATVAAASANFTGSQTATFTIFERDWTVPERPENGSGWAVPPADLNALDAEALAGTAFEVVDLTATRCAAIGARAFAGMDALEAVLVPDTLTRLAVDAFDGIDPWQVTLCFPNGVNPSLAIGDNGDSLGDWAFENGIFLVVGP